LNPQLGASIGFHDRLNGTEMNDMSLEFVLSVPSKCAQFSSRADDLLKQEGANEETRRYLGQLKYETDTCTRGFKVKGYLLPAIHFLSGVQSSLPRFFATNNTLLYNTVQDYKNNLIRMSKIPRQLAQIEELLREGVRQNITFAKESLSRAGKQYDQLQVENPEDSKFYEQFARIKEKVSARTEEEIKAAKDIQEQAKKMIAEEILPAYKKLQGYVFGEYSKHLRPSPAASSLQNGAEFYQRSIEYYTTLIGVTPSEIHEIGLEEVSALKKKVSEAGVQLGYGNITFPEFVKELKSDERQYFQSANETLSFFMDLIAEIDPALDKVFDQEVLSESVRKFNVEPVPKGGGGLAYYRSASLDGKRKGTFFINLQTPKALKRFELMSLTLHEGNPGHHLQLTTTSMTKDLPLFLKHASGHWGIPSGPGKYTAYTEGWALYTEFLGIEMGMYESDMLQLIGHYSWNLLRGARLVVDTGIHAMGWSRQKAIDYLADNTFMSRSVCEGQIDRYITWPGQALSYKMGERTIRSVRNDMMANDQMGDNFDLKAFHRAVLSCIGPIQLLKDCVKSKLE